MCDTGGASVRRLICLGSYQGNDALAWRLAAALRDLSELSTRYEIMPCAAPALLAGLCAGCSELVIVDACPDLVPGTVQRLQEADLQRLPVYSSHGVDLLTALGMARALGDLPASVLILGVGVDDRPIAELQSRALPALLAALASGAQD